jgi:hypothetical protein
MWKKIYKNQSSVSNQIGTVVSSLNMENLGAVKFKIFDDTVEELEDLKFVRVLKRIKKEGSNCLFVEKTEVIN